MDGGCSPTPWEVISMKDPSSPANFRPIVFTSWLGKVYTFILKWDGRSSRSVMDTWIHPSRRRLLTGSQAVLNVIWTSCLWSRRLRGDTKHWQSAGLTLLMLMAVCTMNSSASPLVTTIPLTTLLTLFPTCTLVSQGLLWPSSGPLSPSTLELVGVSGHI